MVGCFLTPSIDSKYTYPAALKDEIADVVGEYLFDTKDFRTNDKEYLLRQVYEMTDRRFRLALLHDHAGTVIGGTTERRRP